MAIRPAGFHFPQLLQIMHWTGLGELGVLLEYLGLLSKPLETSSISYTNPIYCSLECSDIITITKIRHSFDSNAFDTSNTLHKTELLALLARHYEGKG